MIYRRLETQVQPDPVDVLGWCAADLSLQPPAGPGDEDKRPGGLQHNLSFSHMVSNKYKVL